MSDLAELQRTKSVLEHECTSIVSAIHELRGRARKASIEASSTRQPLPESEIQYWKTNIARCQGELMETQQKLGAINKLIREALAAEVRPAKEPRPRKQLHSAAQIDEELFYSFFHRIVCDSLDPRQVAALEAGARSLQADYRKMHGGSSDV